MSNTSAKRVSSRKILQLVLTFLIVGLSVSAGFALYYTKTHGIAIQSQLFAEKGILIDISKEEAAEMELKPKKGNHIIRQRYVRIDKDKLNALIEQLKADPQSEPVLYLNLFPDALATVKITGVTNFSGSNYVVTGQIEGDPYSNFTLTQNPLNMQISMQNHLYYVEFAHVWDLYIVEQVENIPLLD